MHFLHCHVRDTMLILEEVNLTHPQCLHWDMLVPWVELSGCLTNTDHCTKGAEQKRYSLAAEVIQVSMGRDFQAYGRPLNLESSLKYL